MKIIDAAILASMLFMVIALKEEFKVSTAKIKEVMEHVKNSIECYQVKQPQSKKPYLCDADILLAFREELKLDLVTGNKVG